MLRMVQAPRPFSFDGAALMKVTAAEIACLFRAVIFFPPILTRFPTANVFFRAQMAGNGYGSQKDNYSLCGRVPRCAYPF